MKTHPLTAARLFGSLAAFAASVVVAGGMALAGLNIEAAKQSGLVGERPDGLVAAIAANPAPDIIALVESINAERMARYRDIAARNGTKLQEVQALAGKRLISRTPAGAYYMDASGRWLKK